MLKVIENSSLLDVQDGIICHQVNCIGVMGAGLAAAIRQKWPQVFEQYQKYCSGWANPASLLGEVQDVVIDSSLVVANCFGQVKPGHGLMTDYGAWRKICCNLLNDVHFFSGASLHFPWGIGCGLAGGDWNVMFNLLKDYFNDTTVDVYVHRL